MQDKQVRARWFWTFLEFQYGQADSSVCYRNSEVWLYTGVWGSCWNPPPNYTRVWKNPTMARKEDFFTVADFFEINALNHWCNTPCVTKTQRYGYIWYIGSCVEPSHRSTVGCEKSANVLKGKWHKNIRKCKMAKNHFSRSDFGSWGGFLGVLGASLYWKVVSEFWFGHPKCHFWYPQNG